MEEGKKTRKRRNNKPTILQKKKKKKTTLWANEKMEQREERAQRGRSSAKSIMSHIYNDMVITLAPNPFKYWINSVGKRNKKGEEVRKA